MKEMNTTTVNKKSTAEQLNSVREIICSEYTRQHTNPWVIAYSGGKDSTLLVHLVWEMLLSIPKQERQRKIYVVGNDTLVESPLVINHLKKTIEIINEASCKYDLPITTQITKPYIDQTFWVNVIGKGYIPPTRNFRWCTDRMKIVPTNRLLKRLVNEHKQTILLIGTRKSESQNRRRNMKKYGVEADTMNPHSSIQDCRIFAPLADFDDEDVWKILMQRNPPWGGTHRNLITLYRNAGGGECPLVLTKEDAPSCGTTSPRFGCWTCTVIKKDRSMRGVIDSGHEEQEKFKALADFRDWLLELREEETNRMLVRRDGTTKYRKDGTRVRGPFKIKVRQEILEKLQRTEKEINSTLILESEIAVIHGIWRRDEINYDMRETTLRMVGAAVIN